MEIRVKIPGKPLSKQHTYVDVETMKVATPEGFTMPHGEPLKNRWRVIAGGAANGNTILLQWDDASEANLLKWFGKFVLRGETAVYCATREFDEMILRGRFTNARRAHLPKPTWPAMWGAEDIKWLNVKKTLGIRLSREADDIASESVPKYWAAGFCDDVLAHLLRDVVELVSWNVSNLDNQQIRWVKRIMNENGFAEQVLRWSKR